MQRKIHANNNMVMEGITYFSLKWRYMILKIAVAFYLIPLSVCKYLIIDMINHLFLQLWGKLNQNLNVMNKDDIIIIGHNFIYFSSSS